MANPYEIAPPNVLQALLMGSQGYQLGSGIAKDQRLSSARQSAQETLQSGGDARNALAQLLGAGDTQGANVLAQYQNNINSVYGTPIYGTGPDGKTQIGTFDKGGAFRKIDTGDFVPTPGIRTVDTGTGTVLIDSRTGRPMGPAAGAPGGQYVPPQGQQSSGYIPKDVQGEAQQKAVGSDVGDKQANMGKAQAALGASLSSLQRMKTFADRVSSGNVEGITGLMGMLPSVPGGRSANTQANLETLKSQISFGVLQAMREASKTGGALGSVSDQEGQRLENNLAALSHAQDAKQFRKAMQDIKDWADSTGVRLKAAHDQDFASLPQRGQQMAPARPAQQAPQQVTRKTIGNRNFIQQNGQWFEE